MASECSVKVFCRIRPLNSSEKERGDKIITKFEGEDKIGIQGKQWVFDRIFKPTSNQKEVYDLAAAHIVQDVLGGYNGTIFAYGQTASGKTHTMEGFVTEDGHGRGIIPRIVNDIFDHIYNMDQNLEFHIKVSYFEIYMEKVQDLLDMTKTNMAIHEDKNRVPYVKGCTERFVTSPQEVLEVLDEGKANRHTAVTNMNEHSSRSHSVFLIQVKQEHQETQKKLTGKLYLVDLAGSEKVSKTGAEGSTLDEAININKSLTALGLVISSLAEGTKSHIPYRDSKLTRILQESLGGNARTTVIVCASPSVYNEAETKSTVMFGQRAKTIKNVVMQNEELTADEWKRRYEREKEKVMRLRAQLAAANGEMQRWRKGDKVTEADWANLNDPNLQVGKPRCTLTQWQVPVDAAGQPAAGMPPTSESMISLDRSIMATSPSQPRLLPDAGTGPVNDEERLKYEQERAKMCAQLDEKDDDIQQSSQHTAHLKLQMAEQDELIKAAKLEYESQQTEMARIACENDAAKEELKEILQAFEELAMNYDTKTSEADTKSNENEALAEEVTKQLASLNDVQSELQMIKESTQSHKKRVQDMLGSILRDLGEVGAVVGKEELQIPTVGGDNGATGDRIDEEFTAARLFISKMKSEVKGLADKCANLTSGTTDSSAKIAETEKELHALRLTIQQHEAKVGSLEESLAATETKKRSLEEQIDKSAVAGGKGDEAHAQQMAVLRDELAEKEKSIVQMKTQLQEIMLAKEQLTKDFDMLSTENADKTNRLSDLECIGDKKEQARSDLMGLEETVAKELQTLHNLRKIFVQDLQQRVKRTPNAPDEDEFVSSAAQKQKINFLENNLDQLTKVHKQLVRDNADLRCELPKIEKRLRATMERVHKLEGALKDTKENSARDRKRYANEVERIKEAVRQRNQARRGMAMPQIAKPIRPGQTYSPAPMGVRGGGGN